VAGSPPIVVGLNAVIVAVTDDEPRLLTVERSEQVPAGAGPEAPALPFGPLDPAGHRTLELGLRAWVREQAALELGYVEQLYTFADRNRDPRERRGGPRVVSIGYLALVREGRVAESQARWRGFYEFLPWEDGRRGRPAPIGDVIAAALGRWAAAGKDAETRRARRERADITFGLRGAALDGVRVLERYELLYEAGLVEEAVRDEVAPAPSDGAGTPLGEPMALDHRRLMATALGRLRGKLKYRPVVFELLPASFTLLRLQRLVEALAGAPLHKQNFRRLVESGGLVEGTGLRETRSKGRPAELFRFRREVLRERRAPGFGVRD
jgi:hypothetical protein